MNRRQLIGSFSLLPLAFSRFADASEAGTAKPAAQLAKNADLRSLNGLAIKDHEGKTVALTEHAGKLLIINLWGPWCVPCRREMPSLSRFSERLQGRSAILLPVAFDRRGVEGVRQFFEVNKIANLPILTGDGENLVAVTGKSHLPLTLIADKRGNWISTVEGEAVWDDEQTLRWIEGLATA